MFSASTILKVYFAPKDAYSYQQFKHWHVKTKRRWKTADVMGADEVKVLENNRRHKIKYNRPLSVFGWFYNRIVGKKSKKTKKNERFYYDVVGDIYYDYYFKFTSFIFDWWGVGGINPYQIKEKKNKYSIPNTPMLDVSIHLDSNSMMEKLYMKGMTYEEAVSSTFKGRQRSSVLINELTKFNISQGMDDQAAYEDAMRLVEIYSRNIALAGNSVTSNEYNFITNYYNKHIDKKIREMLPINLNFWFLKEFLTHHPNIGIYVLGPYNLLYKIQGIVSKRDKNTIIKLAKFVKTIKYDYQFVYSLAHSTMISHHKKGYIPCCKIPKKGDYVQNMMYGNIKAFAEHRYRTETFYDLILDGHPINGRLPWIDAHHMCWTSPNYSNPKNLEGLDIIC